MKKLRKKPITIPENVEVKIEEDLVMIKGEKGEIKRKIPKEIKIKREDNRLVILPEVSLKRLERKVRALVGLYYKLLENDIIGVVSGFEKKLEIRGIGYTAELDKEKNLILKLGFSHPVVVKKEEGIEYAVDKNIISVKGIDKEKVGNVAAKIRRIKPPDPYKGKGIRYLNEEVKKKEGKKVVSISK
jgi:large subunit ribosomal protein L6